MIACIPPPTVSRCFFFNDTATTEIYTLSLHDALPISTGRHGGIPRGRVHKSAGPGGRGTRRSEDARQLHPRDHQRAARCGIPAAAVGREATEGSLSIPCTRPAGALPRQIHGGGAARTGGCPSGRDLLRGAPPHNRA